MVFKFLPYCSDFMFEEISSLFSIGLAGGFSTVSPQDTCAYLINNILLLAALEKTTEICKGNRAPTVQLQKKPERLKLSACFSH